MLNVPLGKEAENHYKNCVVTLACQLQLRSIYIHNELSDSTVAGFRRHPPPAKGREVGMTCNSFLLRGLL